MDRLFYFTGIIFWTLVFFLILLKFHFWLSKKSFYYSEFIAFISLPYLFFMYRNLEEKKVNFFIQSSQKTKRKSKKIMIWYFRKINSSIH